MSDLFNQAKQNLQKIWGYPDFRSGQDKAISSVLSGNETLVLFPTGGGKSLCYQVPATVLDGLTLVISPLVALMHDQVQQAKKLGIRATLINATISRRETEQRLINARNGMYKLLYVSPERLQTDLWQSELPNLNISLIAIDEAHCISEWGHDFRPPYRMIKESFSTYTKNPRWLALTATATPEVRHDIVSVLGFKNPNVIATGANRANLRWWVFNVEQKERKLLEIVKKAKGSGLVYAGTRRACEELAELLTQKAIPTKAYHAGLTSDQRANIQQDWVDGKLPLVVATNAFGMGIDKPDCRYVIHYDIPYSIENYYQEAGRAGRDGALSYPMVLYKKSDEETSKSRMMRSYPDLDTINQVYSAICDSWHLAIGDVMEKIEAIDFDSVSKRSKKPIATVRQCLSLMEQFGVLNLQTYTKEQLGVQFLGTSEGIQDQIQRYNNPKKVRFADQVYRLFGFQAHEETVFLEMDYLCKKLEVSRNSLLKGIQILSREQLLNFTHWENQTLGQLIQERQKRIPVDVKRFNSHRSTLFAKLEKMHLFLKTKECRTRFIRIYFGDKNVPEFCGNCDYCLNNKKASKTDLKNEIINLVREEPMSFGRLSETSGADEMKLKETLDFLVREGYLKADTSGEETKYSA